MKKILLFIVALVATLSMNAQTTEIHNASGKVAAYLGADVNVKFGMDGSDPTIMVYKGSAWQATYTGSEYKVVSTPVEETFKAVYDTNGGANTLTFYYDAFDHSGTNIIVYQDGTGNFLFDNAKSYGAKWGYHSIREYVKSVVIDATVAKYSSLTSTMYMFNGMKDATSISGAEYLDVSNVTDMNGMFDSFGINSTSLTAVPDVSGWNTGKVTNMSFLFFSYGGNSTSLTAVPDVSGWKTDNVTSITSMFNNYGYYSQNIECELDLSGWNLEKVTSAATVFKFTPKTFSVTIPGKTGNKDNEDGAWYYGSNGGSGSIAPPEGKSFTLFGQGYAAVKSEAGITGNRVKWVQLWEGGPKFAEYNVGATSATEYAGYYAWGGSQDKVDDHNTGSSDFSGDSDTATKLWGNNWRMPTNEELQGLIDNCTAEWTTVGGVKGRLFKGNGDYKDNSVFLPAAGYCAVGNVNSQGGRGDYWSSTPNGSDACNLDFGSGDQFVYVSNRKIGCSVRAVYQEPTTGTAKRTGDIDVKWVQLWKDGPKFAEYNVGATNNKEEDYGGYYAWGGSTNKDSNGVCKDGESVLTGTDDTATNLWGDNWRMPTKDEFEQLLDSCNYEWTTKNNVKGLLCTGKEVPFASNSVFFPAGGTFSASNSNTYYVDSNGYYWSSTPKDSGHTYYLEAHNQQLANTNLYRYDGVSVRAVLNATK